MCSLVFERTRRKYLSGATKELLAAAALVEIFRSKGAKDRAGNRTNSTKTSSASRLRYCRLRLRHRRKKKVIPSSLVRTRSS